MAKFRVGELIAKRAVPQLRAIFAHNGVTLPDFKYADGRLTVAEAEALRAAAYGSPEIRKALANTQHPDHDAAQFFTQIIQHFLTQHPQDAAGEPAPWPERAGVRPQATADNPFLHMDPDEALAHLEWGKIQPEYKEAYLDANHPQHALYVAQTAQLYELSGRASGGDGAPQGAARELSREQLERLAQLRADPAYADKRHPAHADAMAKVEAIYQAAFDRGESAVPASAAATATPPSTEKIAALHTKINDMPKSDPLRPHVMGDLAAAYSDKAATASTNAAPTPVPDAPAGGSDARS